MASATYDFVTNPIAMMLLGIILSELLNEFRARPGEAQHAEDMRSRFAQVETRIDTLDSQQQETYTHLAKQMTTLNSQFRAYRAKVEALPEERQMYGIFKPVKVYTEPSSKSKVIIRLPASAQIEEIERKGQWLYVEYFDYIDWELEEGWVYKRNLVPLESGEE